MCRMIGIGWSVESSIEKNAEKGRLLTRLAPARRDAPWPRLCSRIKIILSVPPGKEPPRQLFPGGYVARIRTTEDEVGSSI